MLRSKSKAASGRAPGGGSRTGVSTRAWRRGESGTSRGADQETVADLKTVQAHELSGGANLYSVS